MFLILVLTQKLLKLLTLFNKKEMMKNKTAQAHVEIILATTLFIGFLLFVLLLFNSPFKTRSEISTINIEKKVLESISSDIGKLSVIVNTTNDCYNLTKVNEIYGDNFIEIPDVNNPRRYTIYYGGFFKKNLIGKISCSNLENKNFSLGVYFEESIIINKKIKDLKTFYQDYSLLKQSLGVEDFAFQFKNLDQTIIPKLSVEPKIPKNVDVVSKDFPVRVMDNEGKIQELILNIKVWR